MRKREGIEPRNKYETVGADVISGAEGNIKGAQAALAPANPPGSKTVARHQGRVGNSGGPMGSSMEGSRVCCRLCLYAYGQISVKLADGNAVGVIQFKR